MEKSELTFDLLRKIQFRNPRLQGPLKPIDDHRLLAGLLFRQWNDPVHRSIKYLTFSHSYLRLESASERTCFYKEFQVHNDCVDQLHAEDCLEGRLRNLDQLYLSTLGARRVVSEWFDTSAEVLNRFAAGAALSVETGDMRWT